ncbi:hypothetical protein PC120_g1765 [Phytophthora cactorum]|nr:hypothetical protein PC120_g1765 [Phytophthora cactorum]
MEHEVCTASGDDIEASASAGSSYCSAEEDDEIVEIDEAVTEHIDTVLGVRCCENDCIASHPEAVTNFLRGYMKMTKDCQRTSIVTALAMCLAFSEDNQRHHSTGVRQRYAYFVPLVGQVCRTAFKTAYNVSNDTINRYGIKTVHGNAANKHAQFVDEEALKAFFTRLASTHADCVPVLFRYQKTVDGELRRYHTTKEYQLSPSYFTWGMMHGWYIKWAKDARVRIKEPSLSSFLTVLERICPEIRIRSVRDNVCDACVIYRNTMGAEPTVDDTEVIVAHVEDAKAMRAQYKSDCEAATSEKIVTTIDYAQNIALPHSAQTPSMWYFISLISVHVFGIHSHPDKLQWNLIYSERKAKKGSTEVISMLDVYARMRNIYSWQQALARFLTFLVHSKGLKGAKLSFLVKGHTKNHCDRHFGYIKRHYTKRDMWILDDVERAIQESSPDNRCFNSEQSDHIFREYKETREKLYKKLDNIQSCQIFEVRNGEPGVVYCRTRPDSEPVSPPPNKEKIHDIHKKVLQYVPPDLRSDPLYIVPDAADRAEVAATKRFRRQKAVQKKKRPAANADAPRKKRAAESDNQ